MTPRNSGSVTIPAPLKIVSMRDFAAPRAVVFEAFSNPAHLAKWWGPQGFTNAFQEFDFRPGGAWLFVMRGPDGNEYAMTNRFEEIVVPKRIVVQHIQQNHNFRMTMSYADHNGGTRLTWHLLFEPAAENENIKSFIIDANEQNFDRLEAYLETLTT